ncbi:imidazole glycerol phosphate synthase subunit HisH [Gammaproteobacteria bacterium]|nr:imidazole glycerol phosphate synthase subunit HisH [Gammaproteobacteria bacterium]
MIKVGVIDYGVGNIRSILNALKHFNCMTVLVSSRDEILTCDRIILPGVGAFKHGMDKLKEKKLDLYIKEYAETSKPLLGICLGMQILFESSEEFGLTNGLGLISGKVVKLPTINCCKLPHISWTPLKKSAMGDHKIFEGFNIKSDMYHVHSFYVEPKLEENILTFSNFCNYQFCSTVKKENIFGVQFHPEKSGENGLKLLHNFINLTE